VCMCACGAPKSGEEAKIVLVEAADRNKKKIYFISFYDLSLGSNFVIERRDYV
jgi:hypothetical protein